MGDIDLVEDCILLSFVILVLLMCCFMIFADDTYLHEGAGIKQYNLTSNSSSTFLSSDIIVSFINNCFYLHLQQGSLPVMICVFAMFL